MLIAVIATIVPVTLLASLIKNINWNPKVKTTLATVLSVAGGVVSLVLTKGWDGLLTQDLLTSVSTVFAGSQLFYKFILDETVVEDKLANTNIVSSVGEK